MAKKRRKTATASRAIVVRSSAPRAAAPIIVRTGGSPVRHRRRRSHTRSSGGSSVSSLLSNERTGAMVGAGVLGLLDKQGTKLPTVPFLGRAGTAGVVLWWLAKNQKSAQLAHAATGCLSIAVYELTKSGVISGDLDGVVTT
jgi:hypothetical protein